MAKLTDAELDKRKATNRKILKWGLLMFVIIITITILGENSKNKAENQSATTKNKLEFSFTVDEFIDRYNASLQTLGRDLSVSLKKENDNGTAITVMAMQNNEYFSFILSANNTSRALQSIIFIARGDDTTKSALDIAFGIVAVVMAIEGPYMSSTEQRSKILRDFKLSDGKLRGLGKLKVDRNNVRYDLSMPDTIGLLIVAEPI